MSLKPVKLGLIGAGFHASTVHIPALALVPELELCAVATSRAETANEAARRHRLRGYASYHELLQSPDIEAVLIATPTSTHAAVGREALANGKHVFLESQGCANAGEARELMAMADELKLVTQVGFLMRYCEPFQILRAALANQPSPRIFTYEYFPYLGHIYNLALSFSGAVDQVLSATQDDAGCTATVRFCNGDIAIVVGRSLANCSVNIESVQVSTPNFHGSVTGRRTVRIIKNMHPTCVDAWSTSSASHTGYDSQPFGGRFLENSGAAPQLRAFAAAIRQGEAPRSTLQDAAETHDLVSSINAALTKSQYI